MDIGLHCGDFREQREWLGDENKMTKYDLWLDQLPGLGRKSIFCLRKALGEDPDFARRIYGMDQKNRKNLIEDALSLEGKGKAAKTRLYHALLNADKGNDPDSCVNELTEKGISFAVFDDASYPSRLKKIPDPPYGLYYRGMLPEDGKPCVAIVGTRMASAYGRNEARKFSAELAQKGVQIISGMARGIDGIAGRSALEAGGSSFAVLGCGADICYPRENRDLYDALCEKGGVISEYPPGMEPRAGLFPQRNRIISALSDLVLVVEAREKSGTLITVDCALEYGIDIYAIPGRVSDQNSRGCNELIRQGAGMALHPDDLLQALGSQNVTRQKHAVYGKSDTYGKSDNLDAEEKEQENPLLSSLSLQQRIVYDLFDESTPKSVDEIVDRCGENGSGQLSYREVMQAVMYLTIKGLLQEIRLGEYVCIRL